MSPNIRQQDNISLEKHRKIMQYATAAGFEFDNFDGQHIEGYSVVRIYKEAPVLFQLINHLDKSFQVTMQTSPIKSYHRPAHKMIQLATSYSYGADFPSIVKKAAYFLTSWWVWTVPLDAKILSSRTGYNLGLGNQKERSVAFNLEFRFDLDLLLHEIIHLKHGEWNEKIIHEAAALVVQDAPNFLTKVADLKPKLDKEFKRIARDFTRFDHKVGKTLGINESAGWPKLTPGFPLGLANGIPGPPQSPK
jgi:hypothetical protein